MKRINLFSALLIVAAALWAQPSETYYSSANGKSGDALREALYSIIKDHTIIGYTSLPQNCYAAATSPSDFNNGNDKLLEDIYSSYPYTSSQGGASASNCGLGWNKEHTVPKSWFGSESPMYSDAFHIYPTDINMNSLRSNYPYGETDATLGCEQYGYGALGTSNRSGYSGTVFEPRETATVNYKGDLARTYFYMLTCYMETNFTQATGGAVMFTYTNNTADFTPYGLDLMMEWHREDPVSEKERIRNDAIYAHQKNRNPFIDYPCLAEYIWGNKKGETVDFSTLVLSYDAAFADTENQCGCQVSTTPIITSPRGSVAFGAVAVNTTATQTITVQGRNLTNNVTLTLSGTNADLFSLSATTVSADEAVAGKTITITYEPTSEGNHTATLTLSSTDAASVEVTLTGNGASTYTITYNAGNGTCSTTQSTELSVGAGVELPTAAPAASCTDWTFAGWSTTAVTETQTAPELLQAGDMYHPTANGVLYAVYKMTEGGTGGSTNVVFNVSDIATKNSWVNGTKYSSYTIDGITISYSGGDNDGKYYSSDNSWRSYANGSVVVSGTTTISNVISEPSQTFSKESDGTWKYIGTGKVQFTQFTITVSGTGGPTTYATSPSCQTCTLASIELNTANVTTNFFVGDVFDSEGLVVTATYSGCDEHVVVPTGVSEPDMSSAGTKTVTVSYTENGITQTATYDITVSAKPTYTINLNQNAGGTISADMSTAPAGTVVTLSATANAHYTFSEWAVLDGEANDITVTDNQFVMPESNVEVEATFVEIQYAVNTTLTHVTAANDNSTTAGVSDGDILMVFDAETGYQLPATIEVKMGNELLTAGYDYEWTKNGVLNIAHTGGITAPLYITIKATPIQYEILFLDDDNTTELAVVQVNHGEVPSYPNATPTKPSTDQYDYTFSGWSPALVAAVDDAIYVAVYTETVRKYTVTFVDFDGKVLDKQSVAYGSAANAPQNPTRVGYTFAGWDKEFNNITSDLTVTATYTKDTETRVDGAIADAPIVYVANGVLHVSGLPTGASLAVFDCTGRLVEQRTAATDAETFALPNGLYLVRVQANGEQRTLKIAL
ncbi:MAG: endonuclease [Bacteroidales bacterium]|nr:endonuclease [Bacteroidales bacterium]